jgi:hypothetical protein
VGIEPGIEHVENLDQGRRSTAGAPDHLVGGLLLCMAAPRVCFSAIIVAWIKVLNHQISISIEF